MRFWKNPEFLLRLRRACLPLLLLIFAGDVPAQELSVEYASTKLVGDALYLDAGIRYEPDEEILLALHHGVELNIYVLVRVRRDREWLWDPLVAEQEIQFKIQHHPLSDDYLVTDVAGGERQQFATREGAFRYAGNITNRFLMEQSAVDPESSYRGYIKVRLQVENLPPPLAPIAYVSEAWRMESSWYEWVVR